LAALTAESDYQKIRCSAILSSNQSEIESSGH
jgi:hypothetical protein